MNPHSNRNHDQRSVRSIESDNPFTTNEFNHLGRVIAPTLLHGRSFMGVSSTPSVKSTSSSPHAKANIPQRTNDPKSIPSVSRDVGYAENNSGNLRVPHNAAQLSRSRMGSVLSLPPVGGETAFKSAIEEPNSGDDLSSEADDEVVTRTITALKSRPVIDDNRDSDNDSKEKNNNHNSFNEKTSSGNSLSKSPIKVFDSDPVDNEISKAQAAHKKNNRAKFTVLISLFFLLLGSGAISSLPVFTCNNPSGFCVPQLTIQLTDKSPAAKTALLTVREALKVLSYLAIDFGDKDNDLLNNSLDSYYQNKVIDAFSVNTVYQLNFLGSCRLSTKNLEYFCMRSYGFDLLSVFVRDAGVQLGQLTKTNLFIMGDSFAIAYELAINGFNKLLNKEGNVSNEYIDWAILLQKFSKGLGFLSLCQFVFDAALLGLLLVLSCTVFSHTHRKGKSALFLGFAKKWSVILMTFIMFLNLLTSFLIASLTLEYTLKLNELATNVGIANVHTGLGFIFIWVSLVFHSGELVLMVFLANLYRKSIL